MEDMLNELNGRYLRLYIEFDTYRKRTLREKATLAEELAKLKNANKTSSITDALRELWEVDLYNLYKKGFACSERQIQAEMYRLLAERTNYGIWVEPNLVLENSEFHNTKPDLIITRGRQIIAIIELKYNKTTGIDFEWDLKKLAGYSKLSEGIPLLTDTKSGNWNHNDLFYIDENCCYVFGVVAWKGTQALKTFEWNKSNFDILPINFYHMSGGVDESNFDFKMNQLK